MASNDIITEFEKKTSLLVYKEFFLKRKELYLDIFLCGKARAKGKEKTLRDKLREELEKDRQIRILYPEDLFIDTYNRDKRYDMLQMETFLANNCDIICIVCDDSPGALVELGAFTNNPSTFEKVVALIDAKYKNEKSFVMLGPVKYIQKRQKENVLFYTKGNVDVYMQLLKLFKGKLRKLNYKNKTIDTLIGQYDLILLLLYYFQKLTANKLANLINEIACEDGLTITDSNLLYNAAIRLLFKERLIEKKLEGKQQYVYTLTEKGLSKFYNMFYNLNVRKKTRISDSISLSILKNTVY